MQHNQPGISSCSCFQLKFRIVGSEGMLFRTSSMSLAHQVRTVVALHCIAVLSCSALIAVKCPLRYTAHTAHVCEGPRVAEHPILCPSKRLPHAHSKNASVTHCSTPSMSLPYISALLLFSFAADKRSTGAAFAVGLTCQLHPLMTPVAVLLTQTSSVTPPLLPHEQYAPH